MRERPEARAGGRIHGDVAQSHGQEHAGLVVGRLAFRGGSATASADEQLERRVEQCRMQLIRVRVDFRGVPSTGYVNAPECLIGAREELSDAAKRRSVFQAALGQCRVAIVVRNLRGASSTYTRQVHIRTLRRVGRAHFSAGVQREHRVGVGARAVHVESRSRVVEAELHNRVTAPGKKEGALERDIAKRHWSVLAIWLHGVRRFQRHLDVGGAWKHHGALDQVIVQEREAFGAERRFPHGPRRADAATEQRVLCRGVR